jgi:hypothetical protein
MSNPRFENPILVQADSAGGTFEIADIQTCNDFLLRRWPGKRGDKHRAALQACMDTASGKKLASNARKAFWAAAREAGILINPV